VADVRDPRWWVLAGAAAVDWGDSAAYVLSDGEPASDTFIGHTSAAPVDDIVEAIARAHAARQALRELDGELPEQPLAVTIERTGAGSRTVPITLDTVAFAIGARCLIAHLHDRIEDEDALAADLGAVLAGHAPAAGALLVDRSSAAGVLLAGRAADLGAASDAPFACVTLGDEPAATARHGHRRAWTERGGPWLGLSRTEGMSIVSTCHLAVDGYGHARIAARIVELTAALASRVPRGGAPSTSSIPSPVAGGIALEHAWREIPTGMRALRVAYSLGCALHRRAGDRAAHFSPTIQIPVAPGEPDDPARMRKRVLPAIASVRFDGGAPEPFEEFADRTKAVIAREATGHGVASRLYASLQAIPAPIAWKRRAMAARRAGWMDPFATVIGGRGCVSKITLDVPSPPACAVSSPARLATAADRLGGCVVTIVDDGARAAITLCGSGELARASLLAELLAALPE
jgi:hypothetical protein